MEIGAWTISEERVQRWLVCVKVQVCEYFPVRCGDVVFFFMLSHEAANAMKKWALREMWKPKIVPSPN